MSLSTDSPRQSSKTCVTCRARKVRCDGRRDICANCERLGFACSYDEQAFLDSARHDGFNPLVPPRRRVKQACLNCHARKAKCGGQLPKCDRCRSQGIECVYRPSKRARPSIGSTGADPSSDSGSVQPRSPADSLSRDGSGVGGGAAGPGGYVSGHSRGVSYDHLESATASPTNHDRLLGDGEDGGGLQALAARTFDNFFRHVHHIPMLSFLHRASLMQRHNVDMVDRALLFAMIGITSLFTDLGPGMRAYGARCVDEAERMILSALDRPSTLRLQALLFVIKHRHLSRRFAHAFMLYATASRFATALRLNHENPTLCFLAQESRRRLMWSIFMLDMWVAGGNADFALWASPDFITIQLPCNERNFEYDLPETTEPLQPSAVPGPDGSLPPLPDDIGFLALHIRIHWIRMRILQFTMKAIHSPSAAELVSLPARCTEFQDELDSFAARLPASFRWSDTNVRLRAYSPRLYVFVMTHVWWQQCHCDLYRIGLLGLREALPRSAVAQLDPAFVAVCRSRCYGHSRAVADMFALLLDLDTGIPVADVDLPLCAYQCARMLYYLHHTSGIELCISYESVSELAKGCLKVAQRSTAGDAALAIQADLERLISQGLTLAKGPEVAPAATIPAASPLLSRNGIINSSALADQDDTIAIQPTSTAPLAMPLPPTKQGPTAYVDAATPVATPLPAAHISLARPSAGSSDPMDISEPKTVAESMASAPTIASDAFEGALEGLDFGTEALGVDSLAWFSIYDLDVTGASGQGDMSM